jgi:hypothetical protein
MVIILAWGMVMGWLLNYNIGAIALILKYDRPHQKITAFNLIEPIELLAISRPQSYQIRSRVWPSATTAVKSAYIPQHRLGGGTLPQPIAAYSAIAARYTRDECLIWALMLVS